MASDISINFRQHYSFRREERAPHRLKTSAILFTERACRLGFLFETGFLQGINQVGELLLE